jgi:hypothetical protein
LGNVGEPLHQQIFAGITPGPDTPKPDWALLSTVRIHAMLSDLFWILDAESYTMHVEIVAPTSASEK